MTSFSMTSLEVDLNEAARCVDTIPPAVEEKKIATIFGQTYEDSVINL